jgi:hypothetical protein
VYRSPDSVVPKKCPKPHQFEHQDLEYGEITRPARSATGVNALAMCEANGNLVLCMFSGGVWAVCGVITPNESKLIR